MTELCPIVDVSFNFLSQLRVSVRKPLLGFWLGFRQPRQSLHHTDGTVLVCPELSGPQEGLGSVDSDLPLWKVLC